MIRSRIFIALLALLLAVPVGAAEWKAYGGFEPDSTYDSSDFMWFNPPGAGERKIYFNAFQTNFQFANPNVGAAHTQFNSVPELFWNAMLGQWVDCNEDGYVGLAETAVEEYRSELLELTGKTSMCPEGSAHNHDGWVTELLWIGTKLDGLNDNYDERIHVDTEAMVWGDQGRPYPVGPPGGGSCALAVMPKGMFHRTGALLDYFDCLVGIVAPTRLGAVYNTVATTVGSDALPPLQNPRRWDEAGHPLNVDTFGEDDAENSYVSVVDCSEPTYTSTLQPTVDPLVPDGAAQDLVTNLYYYGPREARGSPVVNPDGNLPGTINETYEELGIEPETPGAEDDSPASDCDTQNDYGHDFYTLESENPAVDLVAGKDQADLNFNFTPQWRGYLFGPALGTESPQHLGVWGLNYWGFEGIASNKAVGSGTVWRSDGGYATRPPTVRQDLQPANATFWTFYAHVGQEGKKLGSLPSATVGTYGAIFCPTFGLNSGTHHGWKCDGDLWYRNSDGTRLTETVKFARPGQTYELRDVDCFDGTLLGLPVGIETGAYGNVPCSAPPAPVYD